MRILKVAQEGESCLRWIILMSVVLFIERTLLVRGQEGFLFHLRHCTDSFCFVFMVCCFPGHASIFRTLTPDFSQLNRVKRTEPTLNGKECYGTEVPFFVARWRDLMRLQGVPHRH